MADWQAIKTEYITTQTSYRKLSQKHGVSYSVVAEKGKDENWVEQRNQFHIKTQSKTLEKISQQEANRAAKIHSVADKLLLKIEAMVDAVEPENIPAKAIRALTAAVKDLKEIQSVKTDLDRQEQEARIANLRKQADKDDNNTEPIKVIIGDDLSEYSK